MRSNVNILRAQSRALQQQLATLQQLSAATTAELQSLQLQHKQEQQQWAEERQGLLASHEEEATALKEVGELSALTLSTIVVFLHHALTRGTMCSTVSASAMSQSCKGVDIAALPAFEMRTKKFTAPRIALKHICPLSLYVAKGFA